MTAKKHSDISYRDLSQELQTIIESMQDDDTDIDAALKKYERGMQIVGELEKYLRSAGNTIQDITAKST